ncbi:acyltransferase family protein [Pedobacter antarcticus]|uniref:acyltransferase family protein n=1 Tax=Pedobacter antarcticus TaxID=34086 RepID=UPI001C59F626|nr:acyltransferase [Pedobacter antarcticus]
MRLYFDSIYNKLTRITSGGKLIREIDGLRFVAITPVLVQHFTERFERNSPVDYSMSRVDENVSTFAAHGFLGVYIFFVISGFVLALPFAKHEFFNTNKVSIGNYFWRRLTRLEPPYIIWMSVFFLVFVWHSNASFLAYLPHYLANITYTHALIYNQWSPFNPPTWTLEIEIQFYILAPFLSMLFFKLKNKWARRTLNFGLIIALVLFQHYMGWYKNPYSFSILGHLHYFLTGFMIVDFYLNDWKDLKQKRVFDIIGILSLISLVYFWSWDYGLSSRFLVLGSLFVFFVSAFNSYWINSFLKNRWIMVIGGMCYTIYLIHLPFAEFVSPIMKHLVVFNSYTASLLLQLAIFVPVVLVVSAFFYRWTERPFMDKDWPEKFYLKLRTYFR